MDFNQQLRVIHALASEVGIEFWKPIAHHPGYHISNLGRVYSSKSGKLLSLYQERDKSKSQRPKALTVSLYTGKHCTSLVHQLVMDAFTGTSDADVIRHMDNDPYNNTLMNLRRGSQQDNIDDAWRSKRMPLGDSHPQSKLTAADVRVIRKRLSSKEQQRSIAREFGVADSLIFKIKHNRIWKEV